MKTVTTIEKVGHKAATAIANEITPVISGGSEKQNEWANSIVKNAVLQTIGTAENIDFLDSCEGVFIVSDAFEGMLNQISKMTAAEVISNKSDFQRLHMSAKQLITIK